MHPGPGATSLAADPPVFTLGVEEEFLLLDPRTGRNAPRAGQALAGLPEPVRGQSRPEFRRSMIEMVTPVSTGLAELRRELLRLRRSAARAAVAAGTDLVAIGATPVSEPDVDVSDEPRYRAMERQYGPVARDPSVCGCHVHVGVPDRETAVQVCNHLRPWLPVIQALAVNSPLYAGADTGHASWRSIQLERWPSLGPTPYFADAADYDRTVEALILSGVMLDPGMVYWYARPSANYPTVEVRVADVCPSVDDTVLLAGLVRALVATVCDDLRAGLRAPRLRGCLVRAAHWRAAHDGMAGLLIDLRSGRARPAWELVDDLVAAVTPALLRHDDLERIHTELDRVRHDGTGAARQRRILAAGGGTRDVLAVLAQETVRG
ncbi:glutamate--cysteine ligase [Actinoplanes sp. NPDC049316]|uniref:carboxylate-amine ligase n=1 Tax=Actinoplanes sp. NPDC049316 TaxID=3154727 RepID=UPI0034250304